MGAGMEIADLRAKIRDIKDFPTEGILFKDITTLLKDGPAFRAVVDMLGANYARERIDIVVGIESRGFIFAGAVAHQLGAGFVPVRKLGKLPGETLPKAMLMTTTAAYAPRMSWVLRRSLSSPFHVALSWPRRRRTTS